MITTRYYLDTRASIPGGDAPLKIQINKRGQTALLSTGIRISPACWDRRSQSVVRDASRSVINNRLLKLKLKVDTLIDDMVLSGRAVDMSATEIKNAVQEALIGTPKSIAFGELFDAFIKGKNASTQKIYINGLRCSERFDRNIRSRSVSSFSDSWGQSLYEWLEERYAPNTMRSIVSSLSAVFNHAVSEGIIPKSPLRSIRISVVATRRRNLNREQIRVLWNAETIGEREAVALDLFKFSFLTIAMNPADVATLTPDSIFNGRIEYSRAKTHKPYSIRIVPELEPLLRKYNDGSYLFSPLSKYKNSAYGTSSLDMALSRLSARAGLPAVSMYWARHTWASLASELDIPVDVISSALGHSHGARITMVYITMDVRKVDDANRRVIDFALYDDKKE